MADANLYRIAEEILKNVGSYMVGEIASAWGFKSDLDKLKHTVGLIKDFLLDAEERQTDSNAVRRWLLDLTQVVYAADDLFDEFITVATRKQLNGRNKFSNKVHNFFSRYNQIAYAHRIARKIKVLREELEGIVELGKKLELVSQSYVEGRLVTKRRDQSYSFVEADRVIGRDADKNVILDLLLASSSSSTDEHEQRVLPVIVIVGIGGLGKTALAQYIYNDPSIDEFFDLKLWVCVSDVFDVKEITEKILKSATNSETPKLEMDQLQSRLRNKIGDKKYLLVLDDVWNESREEWLKMRALLKIGKNGSKILVTTRSSKVAKIMCTFPNPPYDLQGLSEEKSWELFEKLAFMPRQAQQMPHLVDIGKEMVRKCANVPLAIRLVGSILYGEDESKWLSIRDKNISKLSDNGIDHIMNILKISYHHLASPLKNCFAYCALFPKDYNFNKHMLINLWMAEGFIVLVADESLSLEELGEEYFLTLLQRGLFQDVRKDEWGCIESCKMHDFIHDLAQDVAEPKCLVIKADQSFHQNNIYHLSFAFRLNFQRTIPSTVLSLRRLRTLLLPQQLSDGSTFSEVICQQITSKLTYLRVLDLHGLGLNNLPRSIGKLIHLRYLNLASNPLKVLPDSITELHNLQTLNLNNCSNLYKLPSNIKKLVNLRSLDNDQRRLFGYSYCNIPLGIGNLTSLHFLPVFIITKHANSARLSELYKLKNLRGKLYIEFSDPLETTMLEAGEGGLTDKHGLNELEIHFATGKSSLFGDLNNIVIPDETKHDEVVLESLKPHRNLRKLKISHYQGRKLPYWAMNNSLVDTLSKLVEIELYEWNHCQLPAFSQLPLLKQLSLTRVLCLEYMEILNDDHSSSTIDQLFYPSLEMLKLHNMISLKGWWKGSDASSSELGLAQPSLSFPKLLILDVHYCENLTSLPTCPNVEKVHLSNETKNLSILNIVTESSRLQSLTIDNVEDLLSIHSECLRELSWLCIKDSALVSTEKLGDLFATLSSSLKYLSFDDCDNLISISKGLEHLTTLETFEIMSCDELDLSPNERQLENENRDEYCTSSAEMPWKAFKTSLRSLRLSTLEKLVSLPIELQHLTNLRSLELSYLRLRELPEWINCFSSLEYLKLSCCHKVTCLPESFPKLIALQELRIVYCEKLIKRCGGPNGKDWTKIKHIPIVIVNDYDSVVED